MPKQRNNQNQTISRTPSSYFSSVISNRDDRFNPSVSGRRNDYLLFYFFLFFLFFFFPPSNADFFPIERFFCVLRSTFAFSGRNFHQTGRTLSLRFPYPSAIITGIQDSRKSRLSLFLAFSFVPGGGSYGGNRSDKGETVLRCRNRWLQYWLYFTASSFVECVFYNVIALRAVPRRFRLWRNRGCSPNASSNFDGGECAGMANA